MMMLDLLQPLLQVIAILATMLPFVWGLHRENVKRSRKQSKKLDKLQRMLDYHLSVCHLLPGEKSDALRNRNRFGRDRR